jgi:hypothetical protein
MTPISAWFGPAVANPLLLALMDGLGIRAISVPMELDRGLQGAKERVGPPDAVNTGGPVPLIEMLAGKGGFAGQVRRQRDPSVRPVHCNAKWSLT